MKENIYFLVHGAWHGAWCWDAFLPALQAVTPCVIYTPTLPGRDQDNTPPGQIGLTHYVHFLKTEIEKQGKPVTLVGHSLAGLVVSQVAEAIPDLINDIIYIAAYVPESKHSMRNEVQKSETPGKLNADLVFDNDTLILKKTDNVKNVLYTQCSDDIADHAIAKLVPEPARVFFETVTLTEARFGRIPKKYICCSQDQAIPPADQKRMYQRLSHCTVLTIPSDHSPFLSMPETLARLFLSADPS